MTWENILFGALATSTLTISMVRFGWNSFITLGVLGSFLYSLPAIIGVYSPIHISLGARGYFAKPTPQAVLALSFAWLMFLSLVAILPVKNVTYLKSERPSNSLLRTTALLTLFGYIVVSASLGPLYFLQDRSEADLGLVSTLWRWFFVFGIVLSFQAERHLYVIFFLVFLIMHMIAGDRTIPAIAVGAIILSKFIIGGRRKTTPPKKYLLFGGAAFVLLLVVKPIYLFLKNPSFQNAAIYFNFENFLYSLQAFEPLGTFSLLQLSIDENLSMPFGQFITSIASNILLMPSFFKINSNYFNEYITSNISGHLTFGVAGNYFAHAYVALGLIGILLFAFIFIMFLHTIENLSMAKGGLFRSMCIVLGATIAIYAHRNGLDNLLSFVRQVLVAGLLIHLVSILEQSILPRKKITSGTRPHIAEY